MAERHYVHLGGDEGRERLRVLGRVFAPATTALLDRLEVGSGIHMLDIGCGGGDVTRDLARRAGSSGSVTGIDLDGGKLALARAEAAEAGLDQLDYRQSDIFAFEPVRLVDLA